MKDKKIELTKEEIIENLKLLKFDREKHASLHQAVQDFFSEEKYQNVMNGIVTDSNSLKEVQSMLNAYKTIKDYEDEIILGIYFDLEIDKEEKLDEYIIKNWDSSYKIMKKNFIDDKYELVNDIPFNSLIDGCYIKNKKIYNLQENIIWNNEIPIDNDKIYRVEEVSDKFLKIGDFYVSRCGNMIVKSTSIIDEIINRNTRINVGYENVIAEEMTFDEINQFLTCLYNKENLPYLNEKILFVKDEFICSEKKGCISYYKINGKLIVSHDQDGYFYLDKSFNVKDDGRHIIGAGKYDCKLNKVYGYYDLDNQKELSTFRFQGVLPWVGYGGIALDDENIYFINEDGSSKKYELNFSQNFLAWVETCNYSNDNFVKNLLEKNFYSTTYYVLDGLVRISDNLYIAQYIYKEKSYDNQKEVIKKALIKNTNQKPQFVSLLYDDIKLHSKEEERFFSKKNNYWVNLSFNGVESDIFSYSYNDNGDEKYYLLDTSLKNSLFLDFNYKENLNLINEKVKHKDDIIKYTSNEISKIRKNYLSNIKTVTFQTNELKNNTKVLGVYDINKNGLAKLVINDHFKNVTYDKKGNYFVYGKGVNNIRIDDYDHIKVKFHNDGLSDGYYSQRYVLVDEKANLLIGLSKNIDLVDKHYIVTRCDDKKQVFDCNALPLTLPSDDVKIVEKLYVDKRGFIKKKEEKIVIINCGYEYLLDDEHDYIIGENIKYTDMFEEIKQLSLGTYKERRNELWNTKK